MSAKVDNHPCIASAVSSDLQIGLCSICFDEDVPLVNPCVDKSHASACLECYRGYVGSLINDAYVGSCPILSCPLCLSVPNINDASKMRSKILPSAEVFNLFPSNAEKSKYNSMVDDLTSFQCSGCHCRRSLQVSWDREAWPKLLAHLQDPLNEADDLQYALSAVSDGRISIEECYEKIYSDLFPVMKTNQNEALVEEIIRLTLQSVTEPERRANLQLRYFRDRPFIVTTCCQKKHCFKCKSRNWHEGTSCAENSNTFFCGTVLPCPSCGIQLTKGDGCDHITCICKRNFSWNSEVTEYTKIESFRKSYPEKTSMACARVLCDILSDDNKANAKAWRAKYQIDTNNCLLEIVREEFKQFTSQWCATFTPPSACSCKPAIYSEIKTLWREAHMNEVIHCENQNRAAVISLYTTMFRDDTDRALALGYAPQIAAVLLKNMCVASLPKLLQSQQTWAANNPRCIKIINENLKILQAEQFLCLYGHRIPASLPETPQVVVMGPAVDRFEPFKSDSRLLFREGNSIVYRIGRLSSYPAALAPLSSSKVRVRFRLLSAENCGSCLSIGLCNSRCFPTSSSNGFGGTDESWGVMEERDAYSTTGAAVYANGIKVATWRSLVTGDSISFDCDIEKGICDVKLGDGSHSYRFDSIPAISHTNYCFGTTLATDNVIRIEAISGIISPSELWSINREHVNMFRSFSSLHFGNQRKESQKEIERVMRRAAQWEVLLHQAGVDPTAVFESMLPSFRAAFEAPFGHREEVYSCVWNSRGDKMTWSFIDMALNWGRLNGKLVPSAKVTTGTGGVRDTIHLFETMGTVPVNGFLPVLPRLER